MDTVKKIFKEISVFGIVLVVFIALFAYKKITHGEYKTISCADFEQKIKAGDSFIVLLGSNDDAATQMIQTEMESYKTSHRSAALYYVDLTEKEDTTKYIQETLDTEDGTVPQVTAIKEGKVKATKTGQLTTYQFEKFCNEND